MRHEMRLETETTRVERMKITWRVQYLCAIFPETPTTCLFTQRAQPIICARKLLCALAGHKIGHHGLTEPIEKWF